MSNRQTQGQRQMCARIDEEINHRLSEPEAFAFLKRSLHWRWGTETSMQSPVRRGYHSHADPEGFAHL